MASVDRRRGLAFAAALVALIGGTLAISLTAGGSPDGGPSHARPSAEPRAREPLDKRGAAKRATGAQWVAAEFAHSYLIYEAGQLGGGIRLALSRLCSHQFAAKLTHNPVRIPPGARPPRERLLGLPVLSPVIVEGAAGLLARTRLMRDGRKALLIFSLSRRREGWRVVGVGP